MWFFAAPKAPRISYAHFDHFGAQKLPDGAPKSVKFSVDGAPKNPPPHTNYSDSDSTNMAILGFLKLID